MPHPGCHPASPCPTPSLFCNHLASLPCAIHHSDPLSQRGPQDGVASMSADVIYVLFLDDDISVHPGTVQLLVDAISNRPKALLVTGYPFDIPSKSLFSYCVMAFHLVSWEYPHHKPPLISQLLSSNTPSHLIPPLLQPPSPCLVAASLRGIRHPRPHLVCLGRLHDASWGRPAREPPRIDNRVEAGRVFGRHDTGGNSRWPFPSPSPSLPSRPRPLWTPEPEHGYRFPRLSVSCPGNFGREILVPAGAVFLHPLPDDFTANQ